MLRLMYRCLSRDTFDHGVLVDYRRVFTHVSKITSGVKMILTTLDRRWASIAPSNVLPLVATTMGTDAPSSREHLPVKPCKTFWHPHVWFRSDEQVLYIFKMFPSKYSVWYFLPTTPG